VLTELKSTSAGKLFQTFIILTQKKELRTVWFVDFIHKPSGMRCTAKDKKFININIDKPENNLITPDKI